MSLTGQEISWSRANSNTNCPNNGSIPVEVYDNLYKQFNPTNFDADDKSETRWATDAGTKQAWIDAIDGPTISEIESLKK